MPSCDNCGAHVTEDYLRVMEPVGATEAQCCPACPDLMRDVAGGVREKKRGGMPENRMGGVL